MLSSASQLYFFLIGYSSSIVNNFRLFSFVSIAGCLVFQFHKFFIQQMHSKHIRREITATDNIHP